MVIEGNWIAGAMAQDYPDVNWGVVEIPEGPAGRGTFAFTVCYGVGAESPNPEASWQVIDYLTGPEGAVAWTEGFNVMPARQSAADGWTRQPSRARGVRQRCRVRPGLAVPARASPT